MAKAAAESGEYGDSVLRGPKGYRGYDKRDADCDDLRNLGIVENIQNYMPVLPSPGLVRQVFCCTVQCSSITMKVASL